MDIEHNQNFSKTGLFELLEAGVYVSSLVKYEIIERYRVFIEIIASKRNFLNINYFL